MMVLKTLTHSWFVNYRNECVLNEIRWQTGKITVESQITCITELFSSIGLLIVHPCPKCQPRNKLSSAKYP
jgi:hypothetical protein